MTKRDELEELFQDCDELLYWDGLDDAIIGYTLNCGTTIVIYDYEECIKCFHRAGMGYVAAIEHVDFNLLNTHMGDNTPITIKRM